MVPFSERANQPKKRRGRWDTQQAVAMQVRSSGKRTELKLHI